MAFIYYYVLSLMLSLQGKGVQSFLEVPTSVSGRNSGDVPRLYAKKARPNKSKTKNTSSNSLGGFGTTVEKKKKKTSVSHEDDDYAVFPRLEPEVMETLVQAPSSGNDANAFPSDEVYQRLDQIYGFPFFNCNQFEVKSRSESSSSWEDLIASSPSTASSSSSSVSSMDDLLGPSTKMSSDLDALIVSATGLPVPETSSSNEDDIDMSSSLLLDQLPSFEHLKALHMDPLVLQVDNFFSTEECERYIEMSSNSNKDTLQSRSPTVGKDSAAKSQRTSTTWYHSFCNVPELMSKASRLLGIDSINKWEEPQTVRYRRNEKFTWHLDALGPTENTSEMGGQRIATVLVYLTGLADDEGGATIFRDLKGSNGEMLRVVPRQGSALLFFPAAGGIPNTPFDIRTLHCGEVVSESSSSDKWIAQLWLREKPYTPTAPPGNTHANAVEAINNYCSSLK